MPSADRFAQHTCPSAPAAEQQGPTHSSLRTRPIERPEAVVRPAELRAAALDPKQRLSSSFQAPKSSYCRSASLKCLLRPNFYVANDFEFVTRTNEIGMAV